MIRPTPRPATVAILLVLLVLIVAGCASADQPQSSEEARIAAIRAARNTVEQPVVQLGRAASTLEGIIGSLRSDPPRTPGDRLAATSEIRQEHIPALDIAITDASGVELTGATADVQAARVAYDRLLDAASALRPAAVREVAAIDRATELDEQLDRLTHGWDEPGSRREQLARFAELATQAEQLADEIAELEPVAPCMGTLERRAEAARAVAERTLELRRLIEGYRGTEFDELRSEYRQDPFGFGTAVTDLDADDHPCWLAEGPFPEAWRGFEQSIEELESALNPADLG